MFEREKEYDTWECFKCHRQFYDPEDIATGIANGKRFEAKLYWLGPTEPLCSDCAIEAHIPPVDKE